MKKAILLPIREESARKIYDREKTFEVRTQPLPWTEFCMVHLCTNKHVTGFFLTFTQICITQPHLADDMLLKGACLSHEDLGYYSKGRRTYFHGIDFAREFSHPVALTQIGIKSPVQNVRYLGDKQLDVIFNSNPDMVQPI